MTSAPRAYESAHQTAGMLQLHCARRTPARFTSIAILLHILQFLKRHRHRKRCYVPSYTIEYHTYAKISVRFDTKQENPSTIMPTGSFLKFQSIALYLLHSDWGIASTSIAFSAVTDSFSIIARIEERYAFSAPRSMPRSMPRSIASLLIS